MGYFRGRQTVCGKAIGVKCVTCSDTAHESQGFAEASFGSCQELESFFGDLDSRCPEKELISVLSAGQRSLARLVARRAESARGRLRAGQTPAAPSPRRAPRLARWGVRASHAMDRKRSALSSAGAKLLEPKSAPRRPSRAKAAKAVPLRGRERSERSADVEVVESGRQRSNSHTERPERLEKLDKWEKPSDVSAAKPFSASPSPEPPEPSEKQERAGRSSSRRPREKEQKEADEDLEALLKGLDDASLSPRPSATTAAPAAAAASAAPAAAAAAAPAPVPAASPCKPPTEAHSVTAQGGPEYCTACKKQFEGGQSIYESRLSGEPQSLCKACWSQVAPHCAACRELVSGTMARVGEDTYHQQCLKCAFCKKAINGQLTKMDVGLACSSCSDEIDREFKGMQMECLRASQQSRRRA
ncbi:unnamed protein product [Effrenium voratum]|nr:unnamed protein product [Effrenium voratum]